MENLILEKVQLELLTKKDVVDNSTPCSPNSCNPINCGPRE
jgi:hypothetical protein